MTLSTRYPAARFALALVSAWTGRTDRSIAEYQEAIKLNPSYAAAHVMLGAWLTYTGAADRAILLVEKGISEASRTSRVALVAPVRVILAAACTTVGNGVANGASRGLRRHRGRG